MRLLLAKRPIGKPAGPGGVGERKMTQKKQHDFNAGDFSSRKLMELVLSERDSGRSTLDQKSFDAVVSELASRRHYLRELRDRGLLAPRAS